MADESPRSVDVVLDTNTFRPANDLEFASLEARELKKRGGAGLYVRVLIPTIALEERIYQLTQAHMKALGGSNQIGRLLGREPVTEPDVDAAVRGLVAAEVTRHEFVELRVNYPKIDLERVALDAIHRRPPFSPDKSEKGFRDRLIAETVRQLDAEVGDRYRHAILFVTGDERLRGSVFGGRVGVFSDVGQVVGWINERLQGLETAQGQAMRDEAEALFFGRADSLFSRESLVEALRHEDPDAFTRLPPRFVDRRIADVAVSPPAFLDIATGKRLWRSRVDVTSTGLVAREAPTTPWPEPNTIGSSSAPSAYGVNRGLDEVTIHDIFDVRWFTGRGYDESKNTVELARKWFDARFPKAVEYVRTHIESS